MHPKYEWLKVRNAFDGEYIVYEDGSFASWEESIPVGWYIAFGEKMIEELNTLLEKYSFVDDYRIMQIKEKFGVLCWYESGFPADGYDEYNEWYNKYEKLSEKTCIVCGEPATHMSRGWILPLCEEHRK